MYNSGHHHHHHKQGAPVSPDSAAAADVFEQLCTASTFKSVLYHYRLLCDVLRLKPTNFRNFYPKLKSKLRSWKAQAIWSKFDKRSSHKCYNHGKACTNSKVLIIGAGPCGLRTAIEAQLLGAKVVVVEKRDRFSRNNVLHLWPFVINDLKQLGAKKFYGKFCAGAIDHISIRQLQCILLKVALLLGVEIYENVSFEELTEPPEDQNEKIGWRARLSPADHPANQYEFDVLIGADGKRNTLHGFKRKEFRGKLAIAITANFINKRTELEARVQEISGVAFIFNQKFFKELYAATGIDLENIVYYKDETHYFVMTAKKQSLIEKGVILRDLQDTQQLLHPSNVDRNALMEYAREAADFSTSYQLPHLDFAVNHYGKPDVAMFDFTSMFAAENACRMVEKRGHKLLSGLVGDSLLEPFWPTGSGCARGFLSSFDACWMIRSFSSGKMMPLEVLAERESIYRLLAQTTPENLSKDHSSYSLDPASRYPTINLRAVLPFQVRTLFNTDDPVHLEEITNPHLVNNDELPKKRKRRGGPLLASDIKGYQLRTSAMDLYKDAHGRRRTVYAGTTGIHIHTNSHMRMAHTLFFWFFPIDELHLLHPDTLTPIGNCKKHYYPIWFIPHPSCYLDCHFTPEGSAEFLEEIIMLKSKSASIIDILRGLLAFPEPMKVEYPLEAKIRMGEMWRIPDMRKFKFMIFMRQCLSKMNGEDWINETILHPHPNKQHALKCQPSCKNLYKNKTANVSHQGEPNKHKLSHTPTATRVETKVAVMGHRSESLSPGHHNKKEFQTDKEPKGKRVLESNYKRLKVKNSLKLNLLPKGTLFAIQVRTENSSRRQEISLKRCTIPKRGTEEDTSKKKTKEHEIRYNEPWRVTFQNIERRLRENGEDEETIAKYRDIDASLKRLEMKLREGSTLETGLRGQNKVSNLASQLSSKWERKETEKIPITRQPSRPMVPLPTSGSDLCHFCGNRVYLVERLSAEGKFFHRQCFKCDYCAANLRLGNYIYDREGTYGGKFFCIPHFGLTSRARGVRRKVEDTDSAKENIVPPAASSTPQPKVQVPVIGGGGGATAALLTVTGGAKVGTPTTISPEDRGTTPERVEFENSVVEQSDEEEYLSEDEWTDRNFGASANELDDTDGDEDSDYSDLSDEEVEDEEMEFIEGGGTLTAAETRRLAESWQRRYSTDRLDDDDGVSGHETESDLESDNYSEEYGAEGDESHTATEGEGGDDDDEDEDGEAVKRARELRRMEVNIDVTAPPRKAETSDSGSDTEVASDEESEESDTQIDTDSEFAEDHVQPGPPKEIPTIVIDESQDTHHLSHSPEPQNKKSPARPAADKKGEPRSDLVAQKIDLGKTENQAKNSNDKDWSPEGGEKSASLTNLNNAGKIDLHAEQLKRLLQRTESTEAIAAKKALQLKRQYLLGESANLPRKSVSTADLGNRFKSFMEKISETQKMLNPAPQPSAAMQAFMSTSVPSTRSPISSPSSPHLPARSISLPQGDASSDSTNADKNSTETVSTTSKDVTLDITTRVESSVYPVEAANNEKVEDGDDKLKSFPLSLGSESDKSKGAVSAPEKSFSAVPVQVSSSESSSSSSSESESDYDNVPSGHKKSFVHKIPSAIDMREDKLLAAKNDNVRTSDGNSDDAKSKPAVSKDSADAQPQPSCDKKIADDNMEVCASDGDDFGLSKSGQNENEGIETINQELVRVNAPRSLDQMQAECPSLVKEEAQPVVKQSELIESQKVAESQKSIDELFDQLANDAVEDIERFSELVESPEVKVSGVLHKEQAHLKDNAVKDSERKVSDSTSSEQSVLTRVVAEKSAGPTDIGKASVHSQEEVKSEPMVVEPSIEIVIEECKKTKDTEIVEEKLSPRSLLDADVSESKCSLKSPIEDDEGSESKRSHKSTLDEDISESKRSLKKDVLSSPEGKELTEAELSDWAGDNDGFSAGEDLEIEVNQTSRLSVKKGTSKTIARIASEESLGDTDSAISTGPSKTASVPSKPSVLADLEGIEYMDTGGESASSPEEVSHIKEGYTKLGAETPTTPVAPQISMVGMENLSGCDSKSSDSTSTELEDSSQSSVQEALNNNIIKEDSVPLLENSPEEAKDIPEEPRSISEPPSLSESKPKFSSEQRRDSLDDYVTKSRYEGYIPRFKERVSPFGYVRDSLDVRRNSTKSPLFTPTKQDIEEREKNENRNEKLTIPTTENVSLVSPNTAKKQIERSLKGKDKEKEKDLIREMVMSRISRKTPEKNTRRGSRTSISPLSSTSSRTSLFSPQSSQENLLEKVDTPVNGSTDNLTNGEVPEKKTIRADCKNLLRLDTVTSDLPESGDTFDAEEKRMKVRVGAAFRQDSVLGSGSKRSISEVSGDLPDSGQTFQAEENRSKVRVGALFRDDSVLGTVGKHGSLQDVNVPFADDSQDEEVFVLKEDEKNIIVSTKKVPKSPRKEKSPRKSSPIKEVPSPSHNNLPATPLTHPEQFDQPCPKRELFKVPTTIAPTPPPRTQHAASLKGMYTPIGVERPVSTPNLSTVEREKVREEARLRAKLKTDLDLGLSPPNLADNLREKLKKGSVSESECDREDQVKDSILRTSATSNGDEVRAKNKEHHVRKDVPVKGEESRTKDKEERVRELLAEQREHRQREPEGKKEEWCNKDDRVRERLEEYRQKRRGSTKSSENGDSRPNSQLLRRTTHRPSLLELESLQVFTSSPSKGPAPTATLSTTNTTPSISSSSSTITNAPSDQKSISITSAPAAVMSTTVPSSKQVEDTPASEKTQEKKSGKKSKDRERRRSLIQVFTGMFSKSGDEKKKNEPQQQGSDVQDSGSKAAAQQTNVAPAETPKCAPKSPSSMRDKLSKLRLSRSKEKKAVEKGRSTSADILDDRGSSDDTRSAFSLPTSPSRRPLSSLTSPFTKASSPPQASGSAYSSSPQVRLATPRIEEESLSDDDGGSPAGTPGGTLDRSGQVPGSNSASRRQRNAALRAARQAELKRLRMAQEIQRQLEECEVKTRELEERGVAVEKALRGEGGGANRDEAELMGDWFSMVHEKNALVRWEQELMVRAKELELEDRHVRLEHELRRRMALSEHEKSREDIDREGTILAEILNILEQKDALVNMLEEDRQRCDHSHHHHHHSNKNLSLSTSDTNEKLPQIHITSLPCNSIECSPTTAISPSLTTIPQSFKDSHTTSFSKLSSLLPANNKGLLTSLLNPDLSQCSSLTSVLHGSLPPSSCSSQSSANVSVASSRRSSQFDQFPQNSKPSVFDIDPCSRMCTHAQHARRKVNLFSRLSRVRRTTLPDLSPGDGEPFSDPPLHYRRYSLSIHVPYRMPINSMGEINSPRLKRFNGNPVHSNSTLFTRLLSTACGYALIFVVCVWFLPHMMSLLSLILNETYQGPSPF
nr:protein-methionine sulfoxide oxidase mical3a-like [Penaeus vannamei]